MHKSHLNLDPSFFDRYINQVPDIEVRHAIRSLGLPMIERHRDQWRNLGDSVYDTGKWTIKEILQHIIDTERVFSFRALWIARGESSALPGFDQDLFNANANANERNLNDLIKELISVRQGTVFLFDSIADSDLLNKGIASDLTMSPLALGYMITGHLLHHIKILEERYYPLIS